MYLKYCTNWVSQSYQYIPIVSLYCDTLNRLLIAVDVYGKIYFPDLDMIAPDTFS